MFKIITDNGADMPLDFMAQKKIDCIYLSTILDGKVIIGTHTGPSLVIIGFLGDNR